MSFTNIEIYLTNKKIFCLQNLTLHKQKLTKAYLSNVQDNYPEELIHIWA